MKPIILLNLKTYKEATGINVIKIAYICNKIAKKYKANIILAPQIVDIIKIRKFNHIKIISQHADEYNQGRNTGFLTVESIKGAGAFGTLLNHSEHKINFKKLKKTIKRAKKIKLKTFVCTKDVKELKKISVLKPDYICIEPPELIAGKISISTAKPSLISNSVKATKIPVLAGAGVKNKKDVEKAYLLGARGVLISSSFIKSKNKEKFLLDIINI